MSEFPKIQLQEIEQAGFTVIEYSQPWRFIRGTVKKDNQTYFFKISPPQDELIKRLQKQVSFDQLIGQIINHSNPKPPFRTPQIFQTHFNQTSAWVIFEHFSGNLLAEWTPHRDPKNLVNWLPKIANILTFLDSQDISSFKLENDLANQKTINQQLIEKLKVWAEKPLQSELLKQNKLDQLLNYISNSPILVPKLQHGDFVPWHMIELEDGNIGLIDSEAASIYKPRFYDLAYFYHRVFTKLWQPKLAKEFLEIFIQTSHIDPNILESQFLPILAQRSIGGIFDYENTDHIHDSTQTEWSLHQKLLSLILNQELSSLRSTSTK